MTSPSPEQAVREYRYSTDCNSLMYPALKRWWFTPVLRVVPLWVPANGLTVVGFLFSVAALGLCVLYARDPGRSWLLVAGAACILVYQTLDNVDGPQARRTGTSGPLGELYDHGLDTYTSFLLPLGVGLALVPIPIAVLLFTSLSALTVWASMFQLQQNGTFVSGPIADTEGCILTEVFLLAGAILGPETLGRPLFAEGPSPVGAGMVIGLAGLVWQFVVCLRRIPAGGQPWLHAGAVLLPQVLLFGWYQVSGGALGVGALAMLMGVSAARATLDAIVARLYRTAPRKLDLPSLAVAGLGLTVGLIGGPLAPYQTTLAVLAAALLTLAQALRFRSVAAFIKAVPR